MVIADLSSWRRIHSSIHVDYSCHFSLVCLYCMAHTLQCVIQFWSNGRLKWGEKQQLTPDSSSLVSMLWVGEQRSCLVVWMWKSLTDRLPFRFFSPYPLGIAPRQHTTSNYMQLYNSQLFSFHLLCCYLLVSQNFPFIPSSSLFIYVRRMSPRLVIC